LLAILGSNFNAPFLAYADPISGIAVAALILHMGWTLGKESILHTIDQVLPEQDTEMFYRLIQAVPGVKSVDELLARKHGYYVIVDLKIGVDPHLTVEEGHRIGKSVKKILLENDIVEDVKVHINPYSKA
jgi:cation diffusion facilitator family transporter